jgi:Integrase zinc binding domain
LAEFSFDIRYNPGRVNQAADALSRMPTAGADESPLDLEVTRLEIGSPTVGHASISVPKSGPTLEEVPIVPLKLTEIIAEQSTDDLCRILSEKGTVNEDARGVLCRISPLDGASQMLIPETLRERFIALFHLPRVAGHTGFSKMYQQMRKLFYWPRMAAEITSYVSRCPSCVKKSLKASRKTTRLTLFPPTAPMEFVAMDILGPLTTTPRGNRFLLVVTDRFTKLTRAYPLASTTADVVARTFFEGWVAAGYGIPHVLLTDNGTQFVSKFF